MLFNLRGCRSFLLMAVGGTVLCLPVMARGQEAAPEAAARTTETRQQKPADQAVTHPDTSGQLTQYFADQLMLANQNEIELSTIAQERSTNEDVKQFAKMLIADHSKLNEELQQIAPNAAAHFANHQRAAANPREGRIARVDRGRDEGLLPRVRDAVQIRTSARESADHAILTRLCMINHTVARNELNRSKSLLEQYQGQDFDMAFLGMQIGGHTWLLSELEALDGVGTPEFQKIVNSAKQSVEQHLQKAKSLSQKFEDDRRSS